MPNPSSLLERIGTPVKAFVDTLSTGSDTSKASLPFNTYGARGFGWGGGYSSNPGSAYDYRAAAGDLLQNSVVATCVSVYARALTEAPPVLEEKQGGKWVRLEDTPEIALLQKPNPAYGAPHLWQITAGCEKTKGEMFWRAVFNSSRTQPVELWAESEDPIAIIGDENTFVDHYEIWRRGARHRLETPANFQGSKNDVLLHFKHSADPSNPRRGWCPLLAGLRQIASDNDLSTIHAALVRNPAMIGLLIALKDTQWAQTIQPAAMTELLEKINRRTRGEGAGSAVGTNLPVDITKLGFTPNEMAVDKILPIVVVRLCALLGVDPMVARLGGSDHSTYLNMQEANNDFWEREIVPSLHRYGDELGAQYLPLWRRDPDKYRIGWDISQVAALQENVDKKHSRIRDDYKAGIPDLYQASAALGYEVTDDMKGVRASAPSPGDNESMNEQTSNANPAVKATIEPEVLPSWTDEELDAMTADPTEEDIKRALGTRTPAMQALLGAKPVGQ